VCLSARKAPIVLPLSHKRLSRDRNSFLVRGVAVKSNWQLKGGHFFLAIAYANRIGIPPNRAQRPLPLLPVIRVPPTGNPVIKNPLFLLILVLRMDSERPTLETSVAAELHLV
jgi:hypothetical protein